jgi:hypothetical protein
MKASVLACLMLALSSAVGAQVPAGVSKFGPLQVGGRSPVLPGDPTAHPHRITPHAKFYVLVVAKGIPTMCTFEDCGPEGAIVETLGGWITGDAQNETIHLAGLDQTEVKQGRQSVVVISDKTRRIVGIYPNSQMSDLPSILKAHGFSGRANNGRAPR